MFDSCKWNSAEGDNGQSLLVEGCDQVDKGGYCQWKGAQGDDDQSLPEPQELQNKKDNVHTQAVPR